MYNCGCDLSWTERTLCKQAELLWCEANQAYTMAIKTSKWTLYLPARERLLSHYGFTNELDADARFRNMEYDSYRVLQYAGNNQLENWIRRNDEYTPHALVEYGLRHGKDYQENSEQKAF